MIEPTEADIGRRVIYKPDNNGPNDYGVVMSFNDNLVFVRYEGTGNQRQGTSSCMLHWTGASTADLIAEIARLQAKLDAADSNELAKASKLIHICGLLMKSWQRCKRGKQSCLKQKQEPAPLAGNLSRT